MFQYFSTCLRKYATFTGRARRKEFWYFVLASAILGAIAEKIYGGEGMMSNFLEMLLFVPGVAVAVRRLHDTGRSGWWVLLAPTGIGTILLFFFMVQEGDAYANEYGPDPKPYDDGTDGSQRNDMDNDLYV